MTKKRIEKIVQKFFEQCNPHYWDKELNQRYVSLKVWSHELTMRVRLQLQFQEYSDHTGYCIIRFVDTAENKMIAESVCSQSNSLLLLTDTIWKLTQQHKDLLKPKYVLMYSSDKQALEKIGIKYGYSLFENKIVSIANPTFSNIDFEQLLRNEKPYNIVLSNSENEYIIHNPEEIYVREDTITVLTKEHTYLLQDYDSMTYDKILI